MSKNIYDRGSEGQLRPESQVKRNVVVTSSTRAGHQSQLSQTYTFVNASRPSPLTAPSLKPQSPSEFYTSTRSISKARAPTNEVHCVDGDDDDSDLLTTDTVVSKLPISATSASTTIQPPPKKLKGNPIRPPAHRTSDDESEVINVACRNSSFPTRRNSLPNATSRTFLFINSEPPWSIHLFGGLLDGFDPELDDDGEEWIKFLIEAFHSPEMRQHRLQKRIKAYAGIKNSVSSSAISDYQSPELNKNEMQLLLNFTKHPFNFRGVLALSAIIYAHPHQIYTFLRENNHVPDAVPPRRRDSRFTFDKISIDDFDDDARGVLDAFWGLEMMLDSIKEGRDRALLPRGAMEQYERLFEDAEETWRQWIRLWRPTLEDFGEMGSDGLGPIKFEGPSKNLPIRQFVKELVSSEHLPVPLPPSSEGCECVNTNINCYSLDKCSCLQHMKGYAYECDALKDVRDYVFECSPFCRCWEIGCKNRIVHDGVERLSYMDLMVISASNIHGFGLKATCDIPHGTFIGEVLGQVISPANLDARLKLQSAFKEMNIWVLKHHQLEVLSHGIDTTYYCNHTRFINHSCNPNVRGVVIFTNRESTWPRLALFTTTRVKEGSELTMDYAGLGGDVPTPCFCKEKKCRG